MGGEGDNSCVFSDKNDVAKLVNFHRFPMASLRLINEIRAGIIRGEVAGIAVIVLRRGGLPPIIEMTDAAYDCPALTMGYVMRLSYHANKFFE